MLNTSRKATGNQRKTGHRPLGTLSQRPLFQMQHSFTRNHPQSKLQKKTFSTYIPQEWKRTLCSSCQKYGQFLGSNDFQLLPPIIHFSHGLSPSYSLMKLPVSTQGSSQLPASTPLETKPEPVSPPPAPVKGRHQSFGRGKKSPSPLLQLPQVLQRGKKSLSLPVLPKGPQEVKQVCL